MLFWAGLLALLTSLGCRVCVRLTKAPGFVCWDPESCTAPLRSSSILSTSFTDFTVAGLGGWMRPGLPHCVSSADAHASTRFGLRQDSHLGLFASRSPISA